MYHTDVQQSLMHCQKKYCHDSVFDKIFCYSSTEYILLKLMVVTSLSF